MTLAEWIEKYNKKNPEDKYDPNPGYQLLFREDKGFCEVRIEENMILLGQLAGDGRFFKERAEEAARKLGLKEGGTYCIRKEIMAYIRLFGYRVEHTEEVAGGLKRYFCKHKSTGKWGIASPAFRYETGEYAYFITWEI